MTREEIENSMTLKDAIEVFKSTNAYGTMDIAKSVILKALEQEPCEDAISRQAVLDAMSDTWKHICHVARRRKPTKGEEAVYSDMVGTIKQLPSVNPQESKTGQWINIEDRTDWYDTSYKCSCCGREIITPYDFKNNLYSDYPYCHCGARMVGSQESEG